MSATFKLLKDGNDVWGRNRIAMGDLTLDGSYPSGGYAMTQGMFGGLGSRPLRSLHVVGGNTSLDPYLLRWDSQTNKLRIFRANPLTPFIVEEVQAVANNAARLSNVPAYILACEVTAGSVTGAFKTIPTANTPVTKQCAVNFTSGALAFLSTDAVTSVRVSYIPMGAGPFVPANQVVDESVTLNGTTGVALANQASLVQYVYDPSQSGAATRGQIIRNGTTPTGTTIAIKLDDAGNTTKVYAAAGVVDVVKVTYWKRSALGVAMGYTAQANVAVSSNAIKLVSVLSAADMIIPCYGEVLPGVTVAPADVEEVMVGPSGTVAANVAKYNYASQVMSFNAGDSLANVEMAYIVLNQAQMAITNEAATGQNFTGSTVRVVAVFV